MLPLKANFKNGMENIMCSLCDDAEETQTHLLTCRALLTYSVISSDTKVPVYDDIYEEDANKVESIGRILSEKYEAMKYLNQNPDAHSIVSCIINCIVRAASGPTRGIGI